MKQKCLYHNKVFKLGKIIQINYYITQCEGATTVIYSKDDESTNKYLFLICGGFWIDLFFLFV